MGTRHTWIVAGGVLAMIALVWVLRSSEPEAPPAPEAPLTPHASPSPPAEPPASDSPAPSGGPADEHPAPSGPPRPTPVAAPHHDADVVAPGVLRGRITIAGDERPCVGATVRLGAAGVEPRDAVTDADGRYRIEAIEPGAYDVDVIPLANPVTGSVHVSIAAGCASVIDVRVPVGHRAHGRVVDQDTNLPIAGATVEARSKRRTRRVVTEDTGRYDFAGLAEATSLAASHPEYVTRTVPRRAGSHDFRLFRKSGTVSGRVVDADGNAVAGAGIRDSGDGPRGKPRTTSADDGTFSITGITVGRERRIIAEKRGFVRGITETFTLGPREMRTGVVLTLLRGAVLSGRVVDAAGDPVPSAVVLAKPAAVFTSERRTRVGPDGAFRFDALPAGRCELRAVRSGYLGRRHADVALTEGGTHDGVTITLDRGLTIAGRVVDDSGQPVAGARVQASPSRSSRERYGGSGTSVTEDDGTFTIPALGPGELRVFAFKRGYVQQPSGSIPVRAGDRRVRLTLCVERAIHGFVRREDTGQPVPDFFVRAYSSNAVSTKTFSSQDGRFRLDGADFGTYHLEAGTTDGGVSPELVAVRLEPGRDAGPVELRVIPGARLRGTVVAPDGTPLERASVYVRRAGDDLTGLLHRTSTDADGRYEIVGLPAAKLALRFHHNDWITVTRRARLDAGTTRELDVSLLADGGAVEIVVTDTTGRAIPDAALALKGPDGNSYFPIAARHREAFFRERPKATMSDFGSFLQALSRTDERGRRVRRFLADGPCLVEVKKSGYRVGLARATVHAGATAQVAITLEPTR